VVLHRDVVTSTSINANLTANEAINILPEQQKLGATVSVSSVCTDNRYYTTYRAYIMDSDGIRSNEVQYTVHCNGG
jgi:hypothetical protein